MNAGRVSSSHLNLLATRTALPALRHEGSAVEEAFAGWLSSQSRAVQVKGQRILRNAGVEARHSFLTLEEIFTPCGLTESMSRYREHATDLGEQVLRAGLAEAGVEAQDVDVLITTSCTGYMIPSVDAYLVERLGMRADVVRLPVTEMGCAAGASALIYASEMLQGRPGRTAAVVNLEFPTNTMQHEDFSMDNIVGTALFSDGAACTVLRCEEEAGRVRIVDWAMHQVEATTGILGYQLTDTGLRMNLDPTLPEVIGDHFESATRALLERNGLTLDDVSNFVIHPGGVKILDRIGELLEGRGGDVGLSREVMRRFGNMSSSTVIFILDALLNGELKGGPTLLMSFGPGFGAHQVLMDVRIDT
ncbi:MAG: type III polyketide synthase [Phycisphaerales bacterium JB065]